MALHFVGFKGEEFNRAQLIFGPPDFVHRWADDRFWLGGELDPQDTVIFANGEEVARRKYSFNDSEHL